MGFIHPTKGILFALGGAVGQAVGLVLSKYGMGDYNAFAATQIRIIAALAVFILIIPLAGLTGRVKLATCDRGAMKFLVLGSFFGPFLIMPTVTPLRAVILAVRMPSR